MCVYCHLMDPIFQPPTLTFFIDNYSTLIFASDPINFYTEFGQPFLLFNQQQCFIHSTASFLSKLRAKKVEKLCNSSSNSGQIPAPVCTLPSTSHSNSGQFSYPLPNMVHPLDTINQTPDSFRIRYRTWFIRWIQSLNRNYSAILATLQITSYALGV